jgi:hypothetical protein
MVPAGPPKFGRSHVHLKRPRPTLPTPTMVTPEPRRAREVLPASMRAGAHKVEHGSCGDQLAVPWPWGAWRLSIGLRSSATGPPPLR